MIFRRHAFRVLPPFALPLLWALLSPAAASAQGARPGDLFLVLPFEQSAPDPRYAWLSDGMAELFSERLAADDCLIFPRSEWLAAVEKLGLPPSSRFTRATMLRIAQQMDADYVLYGSYSTDGKQIQVTVQVLVVATPAISPAFTERGPLEDLMAVQSRAAWHVLRFTDTMYPLNQPGYVSRQPPRRMDAFEQYIRGLQASEDARLRSLREAARLDPDWPEPAFALGETYYAARNCEPALIWLSRVPPGHRRGLEASFYSGVCHLLRNDPGRAESAFTALLAAFERLNPNAVVPAEPVNDLAIALSRLGRHSEAARQWQRAQQLDSEQPDYWFNAALGALRAGEYAAATKPLRELLRRNPEDADARVVLMAALENAGRHAEAAAVRAECSGNCEGSAAVRAALRAGPESTRAGGADSLARIERVSMNLDASALLFAFRSVRAENPKEARSGIFEVQQARARRLRNATSAPGGGSP